MLLDILPVRGAFTSISFFSLVNKWFEILTLASDEAPVDDGWGGREDGDGVDERKRGNDDVDDSDASLESDALTRGAMFGNEFILKGVSMK